jgi:hypothetical protein
MELHTKKTIIHLDLDSVFVIKTDLDKIVFGLFKYAYGKGFIPPYIFTANTSIKDNNYLGVLKNNNVRLLDEPPTDVDVLFSGKWKSSLSHLMMIQNMPIFTPIPNSRACVYIDWDNIQVSYDYVVPLLAGIKNFVHNIKVHETYEFYVFLHSKVSTIIKELLRKTGANIITIIKDKCNSGDDEILGFIRVNTRPGDSICVASGDRDFSSMMVEYVRHSYNVFLLYNKQAMYTFKHNRHWLGSIDVKSLKGVDTKTDISDKSGQSQKLIPKTKPCKFYNLDVCNTDSCSFLHICGVCGRNHIARDFHVGVTILKNTICKKYNNNECSYNNITCDYLHICIKCKSQHSYVNCKHIVMYCPLCNITMDSNKEYVIHHISPTHLNRIHTITKIYEPPVIQHADKNHILVI